MRYSRLVVLLLAVAALSCRLQAQSTSASGPSGANSQNISELERALVASWAGTLEYRDFSEPATSSKRVKLPTWLSVELAGGDLRFSYIYDDGPGKTVKETSLIRIDPAASVYSILDASGKLEDRYSIAGLGQLRQGHGNLTLTGTGTENQAPVEVRTTLRVGRNILEITRETGGPGQPLTFRHAYSLVRAAPPTTTTGN